MKDINKVIAYWHNSLCDAELMGLEMDGPASMRVSITAIEDGKLDQRTTQLLFQQQAKADSSSEQSDNDPVNIVVAPIVATQLHEHGYIKSTGKPKILWPLLIPATLEKDGSILPDTNGLLPWIPRTLLEPTSANMVLGDIGTFDEYLTTHSLSISARQDWTQFLAYGWEMLRFVTKDKGQEILNAAGYEEINGQAVVINASNVKGIANNILKVYDRLLESAYTPPLLSTYINLKETQPAAPRQIEQWSQSAQRHLGSVSNKFPLSPSQRESFYNFLTLPEHTILAVSGPPGTGKTTLLHSVIASLWVESAVQGKPPPVIVATSTNNQAVTNVIDSLGQIDNVKRWLPINSFGLYLVNNKQRQETADKDGTLWINKMGDGFPSQVETAAFIDQARDAYLDNCSNYFKRSITSVDEAVTLLRSGLKIIANRMNDGIDIAFKLVDAMTRLAQLDSQLNYDMTGYIAKLEQQIIEGKADLEKYRQILAEWLQHTHNEPLWYSLFSFIPPVQRKRYYRNWIFIQKVAPNDKIESDAAAILAWINKSINQTSDHLNNLQQMLTNIQLVQAKYLELAETWNTWCQKNNATNLDIRYLLTLETPEGETETRCLLNWLDTQLRYELFILATHYWEGKWLQEVEEIGVAQPGFKERRDRLTQENRWRRYALLTPCFVTTMHTGSTFFDYYKGQSEPLFDFIDLLIVDEAGQVTPEVSGAIFALAKQALIVGDTLQIEPVWSIPEQVDRGNLQRRKLIVNDEDYFRLKEKGITASSGSAMKIAQQVSPFQHPTTNGIVAERGMFLAEHRRCVPEIINYCNDLAYSGRLRPKRPSFPNYPWPHMGYVHIKGESQTSGGSRKNEREAGSVVAWIAENKEKLEKYYKKDIDDIVGIITPFSAQKQLLIQGLTSQGITISKAGTVHALQGAERFVVIFSSVYSKRDSQPYFFDRGPNMLNVAVSRAKDSFIVFGDMDIFDPASNTPSGLLAKYLFASENNELANSHLPSPTDGTVLREIDRIRTLQKHKDALARAFERAKRRLIIVSPYLRWRAVDADNICEKVAQAHGRGVEVQIYVDDGFNQNLELPSAAKAVEALRQNGASVHLCHNIHSKIICIDDDVFIEGSFNWLSAERINEEYSRYETSTIHMGESATTFIADTLKDIQERLIIPPIM